MIRIIIKRGTYTTTKRLIRQFNFFRGLGITRKNSLELLYKVYNKHTIMLHTFNNFKNVAKVYGIVEINAFLVGFERNVYFIENTKFNEERFKLVQKLKAHKHYDNYDAAIFVSKKPE